MVLIYWSIYATVGKYNGNLEIVDMNVQHNSAFLFGTKPHTIKAEGGRGIVHMSVLVMQ